MTLNDKVTAPDLVDLPDWQVANILNTPDLSLPAVMTLERTFVGMVYERARSLILDGDLIAVRGRRGFIPILTRLVTRSPFTHTGIALWLDGGLWIAEMNLGGNHLIPASQLRDDFDVFDCPCNRAALRDVVLRRLRTARRYGVLDLFSIAARRLLGWRLGNSAHEICSEFSARAYIEAGAVLKLPMLPAPDEVARAVGNFKLRVDA